MGDIVERLRALRCGDWPGSIEREAADEIKRLRAALAFYADDPATWPNAGPWGAGSTDFGNVARAALKGKK